MRRAAAVVIALVVLFVTPAHAAPTDPEHTSTAPAPTSAAQMNALMGQVDGLGGLFDIARTYPMPDGRWVMFTGDADTDAHELLPVYDNAAVVIDSSGAHRVPSSHPGGHFFPRWEDGSEFWPTAGAAIVGDRAYVFGERLITYPGAYNWTQMGAYGAVVDLTGDPEFVRYFPTPSSLLTDTSVQWDGAVHYDTNTGWIYVHGVRDAGHPFGERDGAYVARVSVAQVEVPHRWKFWTGSAWSHRADLAVPTAPGGNGANPVNGTASSYTVHRRPNGEWQITTKRGGDIGEGMWAYRSANPWGPWTAVRLLPDTQVCSMDCYLAGASTIPTSSGNLLVQWSRTNSTPVWAEVPL